VTVVSWRSGALFAGVCAAALAWQNSCLRRRIGSGQVEAKRHAAAGPDQGGQADAWRQSAEPRGRSLVAEEDAPAEDDAPPPVRAHWAIELIRPRDGEDLMAYRDRVLPIAQAVVEPQRRRVAEKQRQMAAAARLDERQMAELDAAVSQAADEIVNRVWQAVGTEEIWPRLRPSAGVALAADLLTSVAAADRRFRAALSAEQLAIVDSTRFDVADYLVFSVPWEERFGLALPGSP
jgi:hypothetical protein